ncbi:EF-P 5-aminopentanol modification-associated protein YfmH [Streptococcus macacae]|uniref:Peptidase, M16 family n=1 Tax=Streptococcus macacae NCTC 11558 TaxID=764298 RepID=G5JXI8_9STRE|nr:pitrilysin family protein [Streptococcus macacae]EHJ52953.1 peptidase, M16 family [Streptococcus macacae NCTC 11558]SUN79760.1 peptidase [Streptococcus macacae NCTC 11558]
MASTRLKRRKFPEIEEEFYYNQLASGIKVYLLPKTDFKETYALVSSNFGSIDTKFTVNGKTETYPAGIAHFLEHQLFEMEKNKDASYEFTKLGADSNAYTSFERTVYYFSSVNHISANLELLQHFTSKPSFTDMSIQKEKAIIAQEIDMYQDDPDDYLYQGILAKLYPKSPLSIDITGTKESINHITIDDLRRNFQCFYHPTNLTLLVAGNFEVKKVYKDIVAFQKQNLQEEKLSVERLPLDLFPVESASSIQKEVTIPKLAIGFRFDFTRKKNKDSLLKRKLLVKIFFSLLFGWTSENYQKWYEDGRIDDSFDIKTEVSIFSQFAVILLDTKEPIAMSNQIRQSFKNFEKSLDFSEESLQTVKNELYGDFIRSLDSIDELSNRFIEYLTEKETYFDYLRILQDIKLEDIQKFGIEILKEAQITDFTLFPK